MDSRWYLAQTLDERIKSFREGNCSGNGTDAELAHKRLDRWRAGMDSGNNSVFQRFLSSINLSETEFREILGQSQEKIQESTGKPLDWVNQVLECLNAAAESATTDSATTDSSGFKPSSDFLALIDPLISHFRSKLQSHANELLSQNPSLPFQSDVLVNLLTEQVATRLRKIMQKTLILETNIARLEDRLSGETKAERFESFIKFISTNEGRLSIYLEYPVLVRRVLQLLEQWNTASCEFIDRLINDYKLLDKQFSLKSSPVIAIFGGAGDVHCQGRSVHVIEFANKKKVVYKPRSLAVDCVFSELLQFLAKRGMKPQLKMPVTLDRGEYGWCEFIAQENCKTESEIKRFYERHGVWLALLHALATCDLHLENLIACGEYPVVIDLETVFHPEMIERKPQSADDLAMIKLFDSVMSVGLLPNPLRAGGRSLDSSGIGAKPDQVLPFDVDSIEDLESDGIHVGKAPGRIGEIHSNPRLRGSIVEAVVYHKQIKKGYAATYHLLQALKDELICKGGWFDRFNELQIRAVIRPTSYYGSLKLESLHPSFNRKYLDQDLIIKDLWSLTRSTPCYEKTIASERRQLLAGDIPFFSTTPDSTDITGGDGTVIEAVLAKSGRQVAEGRLQEMCEADLNSQLWFIDAALQTMTLANTPILQAKGYPRKCTDFLDAAIACGDRLVETAVTHLDQCSWVCLEDLGIESHNYKLGIMDQNMYRGSLGIALFLAYLHALTGNDRYREIAEGCLNQLHVNYYSHLRVPGAYVGICGLIYVNMHLAKLFNYSDSELHQKTNFALNMLPSMIEGDQMLDLISGCSGAVPVLLAYSSRFPDSIALELARACGEKLLAHASPGSLAGSLAWKSLKMSRGFSHGLSGIAFALSELAAATNEEKYFSAFIGALAEEAELLKGNTWTDFPESPQSVAWCHGAAGIALSRMKIYERHKLPPAKEEALKALNFLLSSPTLPEHIICHGSLGNLEPLLLASQLFADDPIWQKELQLRSERILNHINSNGWSAKVASQVIEPGLMTGLAGIGYELLRLHASQKVPSVLALEKPF